VISDRTPREFRVGAQFPTRADFRARFPSGVSRNHEQTGKGQHTGKGGHLSTVMRLLTIVSPICAERIQRIVRQINESKLSRLPMTLMMWRSGTFIAAVDVQVPAHLARSLGSEAAKDRQAQAIAKTLRTAGATAYSLFSEGWAATTVCPHHPFAGMSPSERPDRTAIVIVAYEDALHSAVARHYPIMRRENGTIELGEYACEGAYAGRFSGLLEMQDASRN
jgi:hypothetical protein